MAAFSMIELVFALGLAATLVAAVTPAVSASVDDVRAVSAARHVAGLLGQARLRSIVRGRDTAVRVTADASGYVLRLYEDGNRNGVLSKDVQDGTDPPVGASERLREQFPGVDFGTWPGLPGAEGSTDPGTDPIRLGSSDLASFAPGGTATSGSLYLHSRTAQLVVRIYGVTGRVRVLRYNRVLRTWQPL